MSIFKAKNIKTTQTYYSRLRKIMAELDGFTDGTRTNKRELYKLQDKVRKLETQFSNNENVIIPTGDIYLALGIIFLLYKNWEGSMNALDKCIKINEGYDTSTAHRYKGLILLNEKADPRGALREFNLCKENLQNFSDTVELLDRAEIIITADNDLGMAEVDSLIQECQYKLKANANGS